MIEKVFIDFFSSLQNHFLHNPHWENKVHPFMNVDSEKEEEEFFNLSNAPQNSSVSRANLLIHTRTSKSTHKKQQILLLIFETRYGQWGFFVCAEYTKKKLPPLFKMIRCLLKWFYFTIDSVFFRFAFLLYIALKIFKSLIAFPLSLTRLLKSSQGILRFFLFPLVVVYISRGFVGTEICIRSG